MSNEKRSEKFRLKEINETRNCFIEKIKQNYLMNKKHKKVCMILNYIEHLLILISKIAGSASVPPFSSLVGISIGVASSVVGLKTYVITERIKKLKVNN